MPAIPPSSAGPVAGVIVPPPAPAVTVFSPSDSIGPYVPVRFTVADPNNARVSVKIRFSVAGAAFRDATPAPTSDSVTDLPAPNVEADYRFIWNAKADVGATASPVPAQLEFAPTSSSGPGAAIATSVFQVDTKPKHAPAALPRPVAAPVLSFDIVSGSGQKGIGGQWLPQKVQVVLHDAQANKITGVAVRFTAGGAVAVDIERDPSQPFVTDWSGVAGVRVRVRPGATGSGWIQAGIVGMPGVVSQTIPFTVTAPVIYHNLPPNVKFLYGTANGLTVDYNDAANNVVYYEADPLRPVRFKLEGVSCLLSHSEISLPHDAAKLSFVPTIFTGNAQIRVLDPVSGTVLKTIPVSVDTPVTHRTARASGPQPWNPVQLRLKVVSGLTAPTQPQVGYPGLMLLQGFALQIDDGVTRGAYASVPSAPSFLPCAGPGPSSSPLLIDYDARGSGTLAPSTTANAKPQIQALSGKSVFFIPSGEGPWFIRARVNASILDTSPLPVAYPDPTDPTKTVCY